MYQVASAATSQKLVVPLLSIKEFSELSGIPQSTLRYWDEQGLVRPARRNERTRYRYYAPDQVMEVNLLQVMLSLDMPLKKSMDVRDPLGLFRTCHAQLGVKITEMQARQEMLHRYVMLAEESQPVQPEGIEVQALPAQAIHRIPLEKDATQARNVGYPLGCTYLDLYDLLEKPDKPAQMVSFDPQGPESRSAGEYLVGTAICRYGETGGLPRRILEFALHNGLELQGPVYTVYMPDADAAGTEEYLLQVSVMVNRS